MIAILVNPAEVVYSHNSIQLDIQLQTITFPIPPYMRTGRPATFGIFFAQILLEMPFKRMKKFFFPFKNYVSSNFVNFPNRKKLPTFCKKTSAVKWKRHKTFSWNIIIWCAFYSKFASFNDIENNQVFFQGNQRSYVFEKFYYFSRILREICYNLVIKIFQRRNSPNILSGQCRVIVKKTFASSGWFFSIL